MFGFCSLVGGGVFLSRFYCFLLVLIMPLLANCYLKTELTCVPNVFDLASFFLLCMHLNNLINVLVSYVLISLGED